MSVAKLNVKITYYSNIIKCKITDNSKEWEWKEEGNVEEAGKRDKLNTSNQSSYISATNWYSSVIKQTKHQRFILMSFYLNQSTSYSPITILIKRILNLIQ